MKKITLLLLLASFNLFAADTYIGGQYSTVSYSDALIESSPVMAVGRFGVRGDYLGMEARAGTGITGDHSDYLGNDVYLNVDTMLGVYGTLHASIARNITLYGLAGVTKADATVTVMANEISVDDNGTSYGIGLAMGLNNAMLSIEYMQYLNKSDFDASAIALGMAFNF